MQSAPRLVIVSGAPGSGKTTLARRLSQDLAPPLLAKDPLKEAIADAMGVPGDVEGSGRIGAGAHAALFLAAGRMIEVGCGLILESNFRRGLAEEKLRPLTRRADARLAHCHAEPSVLVGRYSARFHRDERHAVHLDGRRSAGLAAELADGRFDPIDLGISRLIVDTTDEMTPPYAAIRDFAALAAPRLRT